MGIFSTEVTNRDLERIAINTGTMITIPRLKLKMWDNQLLQRVIAGYGAYRLQ